MRELIQFISNIVMPLRRTQKVAEVRRRLLDRLENGLYRAGDRFLSNRDVAEQFGISYQTAHRVIAELCDEGHLERRPQSGTYVPGGTRRLVGVQLLFHVRAAQQWSFGSKLLELLRRKLETERIDAKVELVAETAPLAADRLPIVWELPQVVAACAAQALPAVLINNRPASGLESLYIDSVSTDDFSGGACAAQLLRDRVLRDGKPTKRGFVAVSGPADDARSRLRLEGFLSVLPAKVVVAGNWFYDHGYRAAEQVLKAARSGIFCVNDQLAAGILGWCRDHRRSTPPIIGFDDAPIAETLNLTTIGLPWDEMLDGVVRTAKRRLAGDRSASSRQMFHPKPTVRSLEAREPSAAVVG